MNRERIFRRKKNNEKRFGKETFVFDLRFQHFADGNTTSKREGGREGRKGDRRRFFAETTIFRRHEEIGEDKQPCDMEAVKTGGKT